jgi:peptide/nickel transport system ATP-binding protein
MYLLRIVEGADHAAQPAPALYPRLAGVDCVGETGQEAGSRAYRRSRTGHSRARMPVQGALSGAVKQCETDDPALRRLPDGNAVACHLA